MEDRTEQRTAAAKLSFMRSRLARKNAANQMPDLNIKTAYDNAKFDIDSLLNLLEMEMDKTPNHITWGHVTELTSFRQTLIEALSGMTGTSEHAYREALIEIREDAQIIKEQEAAEEKRRLDNAKQHLNEVRKEAGLE